VIDRFELRAEIRDRLTPPKIRSPRRDDTQLSSGRCQHGGHGRDEGEAGEHDHCVCVKKSEEEVNEE
jgi:hypothetical protein